MDSGWDSASFEAGTLECLLCRENVEYVNGDEAHIIDHLKTVHEAKYHHNLILAITFMDNKTLNNIISQFEKHIKSVGDQIADIFGIDATDEGLLEENDTDEGAVEIIEEGEIDADEDNEEIIEEMEPEVILEEEEISEENEPEVMLDEEEISEENEPEVVLDEEEITEEIKYEDILAASDYFKSNPKQITKNCNPDLHSGDIFPSVDTNLPSGWKVRDHQKVDESLEKHFLAPDGRVIKSKRAVIEYMKIMEKNSVTNIMNVVNQKDQRQKTNNAKRKVQRNEVSDAKKGRRSTGGGKECPECHKFVSCLERHMEDIHAPAGHLPCRGGCGKVFKNKNCESSHYSRNCKNRDTN